MSLHLNLEDFNCAKCGFLYYPYKSGYACPQCNFIPDSQPEEYAGLIDGCVASLKINKRAGGMFIPRGYAITSYSDQVMILVAGLFHLLESESPVLEEDRIKSFVEQIEATEPTKKHFGDIFADVQAQYEIDPYVPEERKSLFARLLDKFGSIRTK